jgi:Arc/MetJ-type ribon-helix-helix transcriptional regulator
MEFHMGDRKPFQLRMPDDLKAWIEEQAYRNRSSQNSEVVRALRAAMDRETSKQQASEGAK